LLVFLVSLLFLGRVDRHRPCRKLPACTTGS
jgi:hypothetical protein